MSFINLLVETEESKQVNVTVPLRHDYRMLEQIVIGDYALSIQASALHHCTPKETLDDFSQYSSMEMALLEYATGHEFLSVPDILPTFSRLKDLEQFHQGPVYSYVPVDLLEQLFNELMKEFS